MQVTGQHPVTCSVTLLSGAVTHDIFLALNRRKEEWQGQFEECQHGVGTMPPSLPPSLLPGHKDRFAFVSLLANHGIGVGGCTCQLLWRDSLTYGQDDMDRPVQHCKLCPWSSWFMEARWLLRKENFNQKEQSKREKSNESEKLDECTE